MYNPACQAPGGRFFSGLVPLEGSRALQDRANMLHYQPLWTCFRFVDGRFARIEPEELLSASHSPELARHSPEILSCEL